MALKNLTRATQRWVKELKTGVYKRTTGTLVKTRAKVDSFCCLGVACVIQTKVPRSEWDGKDELDNVKTVRDSLNLTTGCGDFKRGEFGKFMHRNYTVQYNRDPLLYDGISALSQINDDCQKIIFKQIGEFIATEPHGLFKEKA
jgi:hypothetical protein